MSLCGASVGLVLLPEGYAVGAYRLYDWVSALPATRALHFIADA